jgi:hypothetical protein
VRQCVGLSGPRAGDDQKRRARRAVALRHAVLDGKPLLIVEGIEIGCGGWHDRGDSRRPDAR